MRKTGADGSGDDQLDDGLFAVGRPVPVGTYLRDLWHRRDYLVQVPLEDLRVQNAHTLLGNLWLLLNPVLQVAVYLLVFGVLIDLDRGVDDYLAFLTVGVFVFHQAQRTIAAGARSVVANVGLVRALRFPRAALPVGSAIGQLLSFAPVLVVMLAVTLAHGYAPNLRWLALPALLAALTALGLGGGLLAARANHTYRDLENLLPFLFRLLFYLSGVLYSVDHFVTDEALRALFALDPLYCLVTTWRWALIGADASGLVWAGTVGWPTFTLLVGFTAFRARETSYGSGA
ncbi:MAG: ABC transporter permease [Actinomycetota bacterium]|nr:ABC transporter permease [Actinomycetota bacterium]MEC9467900.1 ABC transporter permease [Actinomycetota bacterium]MED6328464.1 ABC transporter permease [Actinomycetota bacterium]MEE2958139.1 ABC transporter permease [Actinomycetota bacterium]